MNSTLDKADKRIIRLATAWTDMSSAASAFSHYESCLDDDLNYHLLLSLVTCYGRPFLRRDGIGTLGDEYRLFPDFVDDELNDRHYYFMALRNQFFAHTTLHGVRLKLIPPNVPNPDKPLVRDSWDFNLGLRTFNHGEYKVHVKWAYPVIPALMTRLQQDIRHALQSVAQKYPNESGPFELATKAEHFDMMQCMVELKKRDKERQRGQQVIDDSE